MARTDLEGIAAQVVHAVLNYGYEPSGIELEKDYGLSRSQRRTVCANVELIMCDTHTIDWAYVPSLNRFVMLPSDPDHPQRREAHEFWDRQLAGLLRRREVLVRAGRLREKIQPTSAFRVEKELQAYQQSCLVMTDKLKFQKPRARNLKAA